MARPIVLVLVSALGPGIEAAGPNISLTHLSMALADEFDFRILARDRPFGAAAAAIDTFSWHDRGFARFRYFAIGRLGARGLGALLRETPHDLLWLNSFWDREFTLPALLLRRLGRIPARPVLVSPRGEFGDGAVNLKPWRKQAWLAFTRATGLLADVWLHATSAAEHADIAARCSWSKGIVDAPNVRAMIDAPPRARSDGPLRLVFLGRVSQVKNLDYALEVLAKVETPVDFDIYGPLSDVAYWDRCRPLIAALPPRVRVRHCGEIPNVAVPEMLAGADMLFLPTMGENFGHAIFEALACGVPVLISDQTPWRDLARQQSGWDLPLASPEAFAAAIAEFAAMNPAQRRGWRSGARAVAEAWLAKSDAVGITRDMLVGLVAQGRVAA